MAKKIQIIADGKCQEGHCNLWQLIAMLWTGRHNAWDVIFRVYGSESRHLQDGPL